MADKKPASNQSILDTLASVKLAISLLIILAGVAIIGTILPQGQQPEFYFKYFTSQAVAKFVLGARMDQAYTAWWFLLLLGLLALNLLVCSIKRLPKTLKATFDQPDPEAMRIPKLRQTRTIFGRASFDDALAEVRDQAKRFSSFDGILVEGHPAGDREAVIIHAQAGRWSRLGAYVVHVSILIFFAAGLLTGFLGFKGYVQLFEGESADHIELEAGQKMELGFTVRLDKFIFEQYDNGAPKTFQSDLSFLREGKVVHRDSALVNTPVTFGKITFYQSGYGDSLESLKVQIETKDGRSQTVSIPTRGRVAVEGLGHLAAGRFHSDMRGLGPAAQIGLWRPGQEEPEVFWILSRAPFQMRDPKSPEVFKLEDVTTHYYSGLQANYDPGIWFVWIGGIVMLIGLMMALFMSHTKLWIEIRPHPKGVRLVMTGSTHRNQPAFDKKFSAALKALEDKLQTTEAD